MTCKSKTILGIIPARGGSKRIPNKNIKDFSGKPLIAWTIEAAKKSIYIDKLILSSDNLDIIDVAKKYDCEVPFIRDSKLARDNTTCFDVIVDIINKFPDYDYIIILQPTSPLRTTEDIDNAVELCLNNLYKSCVSVTEVNQNPNLMYSINTKGKLDKFSSEQVCLISQNLSKLYHLNGAIYLNKISNLMKFKEFVNRESVAFIMPEERSIDIDTEFDFKIAEFFKRVKMNNIRIIPRIDIKGSNLVKGVHLEGLRVLGRPEEFAKYYFENGADEIIYMDVVASLYGRNSLEKIITRTANNIFIPLTVGGGIRTLDDIKTVLRAGADKVSINSAALCNPLIIEKAAKKYGSSTIIVSIEAIKTEDSHYLAYSDNGREESDKEVLKWAKLIENLGAGEILLTSIDNEGTGRGYDVELTRMVSEEVSIPVIACGGAGNEGDFVEIVRCGKADAISAASIFHYDLLNKGILINSNIDGEGNVEYLLSKKKHTSFNTIQINDLKEYLRKMNIDTRIE